MDPSLILFAIQSLIQIGSVASAAYEQAVRDAPIKMPNLPKPTMTAAEALEEYFNPTDGIYKALTAPDQTLANAWANATRSGFKDPIAVSTLLKAANDLDLNSGQGAQPDWSYIFGGPGAKILLAQWSDTAAPMDAWQSIALTLAQVALGFIGAHPQITGASSNGDKLLQALCSNLQQLLPDPSKTTRANFVQSVAASILHAGLKTIATDSSLIVNNAAAATLISRLAQPLVNYYDRETDPAAQLNWIAIRDTVFPQMVEAGLTALSNNEKQLLGKQFDPNDRLGALTQAFLQSVSTIALTRIGSPQAWVPVYQSILKTIAAKPSLFAKGNSEDDKFFSKFLGDVAGKFADSPPPFDGQSAINLGVTILDQLAAGLPSRGGNPWDTVAASAISQIVDGLKAGGTTVSTLLPDALTGVLKAILTEVTITPGMILGKGSSVEVQAIVASIAKAMAQDTGALITQSGWEQIASVAASTAAQNPGKLFKLDDATPEGQLATGLISQLLTAASKGFANGRSTGSVLFGDTLVSAIEQALKAAAGNATAALTNEQQITTLVMRLNGLTSDSTKPIGAAEWSWLFQNLVADVLDKGSLNCTDDQLRAMLYQHQIA
jgi:hypothetical protein